MYLSTEEEYIFNYLSGHLSDTEKELFDIWLDESESRRQLFKRCCKEYYKIRWSNRWNEVSDDDSFLRVRERLRKGRRIQMFRYVALVVTLLSVAGGFLLLRTSESDIDVVASAGGIFRIDANQPVLTLGNGEQIVLSADTRLEKYSLGVDVELVDSNSLRYDTTLDFRPHKVNYNTLTIPRGCEFYLTLSDGSRVWLNAGSELKYPEIFCNEVREVYLSGEAYFEIAQDFTTPFKVYVSGMELEVLGTSFNIQAYGDEDIITTTLVTGKIEQYYPTMHKKIVLEPSKQSIYNRSSRTLMTRIADIQEAIAWKDAKIIVRNQRLDDILRSLARWYDFEVVYEYPELKDIKFHLHSERFDNIRMILDVLQATNAIHVRYQGNRIYISK